MAFRSPNPGCLPYLRGFAKYWSSLSDMRLSTSGRKYQSPITAFGLQRNQHTVRRINMSPWDRSSWLASELSGRPPSYCAILKAEASKADITRLESRIQHQWAIFKPNSTSKPDNGVRILEPRTLLRGQARRVKTSNLQILRSKQGTRRTISYVPYHPRNDKQYRTLIMSDCSPVQRCVIQSSQKGPKVD